MSQWLDVKAGSVSDTWGVAPGEARSYMTAQTVSPTQPPGDSNPTSKSWYGWAMLGLAAVAAMAALKKGR